MTWWTEVAVPTFGIEGSSSGNGRRTRLSYSEASMRARYIFDSTSYVDQFPLVPSLLSQRLDIDDFSRTEDHLWLITFSSTLKGGLRKILVLIFVLRTATVTMAVVLVPKSQKFLLQSN